MHASPQGENEQNTFLGAIVRNFTEAKSNFSLFIAYVFIYSSVLLPFKGKVNPLILIF